MIEGIPMKVLVVEDEHKIAAALKKGLELERFVVDVAYDGDTGLMSARSGEHDIIVLDRMLPGGIDGIGICETLRKENIHTPIIMLTAKDLVNDRVAGLDAGADDYLIKPFSFEELLARVRALLRRPHDELGVVLKVQDLSLHPSSYQVERAGSVIQLTQTEFSLLEFFMRHEGQVLSKDTIITHVWDFDADILPNTVEAYVGYLRTKIDKPFGKKKELLQTVRGFGYRLGEPKK
jgi:two-component system OmpR family response regulator